MTRLLSTIRLDLTTQWRNRIYLIGIVTALGFGLGLNLGIPDEYLPTVLPLFALITFGGTAILYVMGMTLFEKDEGTLDAQSVTPLNTGEYITSKVITLTFLAVLEGVITAVVAMGFTGYNPLLYVAGLVSMGVINTLIGFIIIVRYKSITDAFVPLLPLALVLESPALHFLGIWDGPWWYLFPTTPAGTLMWDAWNSVQLWELVYSVVYSIVVIAVLYRWALREFHKYIVMKEA
jgi:fluoroquinolone transport system permease protein